MTKKEIHRWTMFFDLIKKVEGRIMEKQKQELIKEIKENITSESYINALYEVVIEKDFDYIENLFPTKQDFEDFIDKYKNDCKCGEQND